MNKNKIIYLSCKNKILDNSNIIRFTEKRTPKGIVCEKSGVHKSCGCLVIFIDNEYICTRCGKIEEDTIQFNKD